MNRVSGRVRPASTDRFTSDIDQKRRLLREKVGKIGKIVRVFLTGISSAVVKLARRTAVYDLAGGIAGRRRCRVAGLLPLEHEQRIGEIVVELALPLDFIIEIVDSTDLEYVVHLA